MDPQIYSDNSSPRSFHSSLDVSSYSYSPAYPLSKKNSYSFSAPIPLQVSTSTSSLHDQDPNERTARPGNAHAHTQFHHSLASLNAPEPDHSESTEPSNEEPFSCVAAGITGGLSRPLKPHERERLAHLDKLKFFLATAPSRWDSSASPTNPNSSGSAASASSSTNSFPVSSQFGNAYPGDSAIPGTTGNAAAYHAPPHPALNRFLLPSQEFVTCVLWNGLYHITGTDIVRALVFRFEAFGRPVRNMKKFEEGVFSDLRNLKPGVDACLEDPKSPFLDLLFKYQCIRTQKKQKVFYWFSVPHDRLFLDALERDLKREKMGMAPTTEVVGEPALSFTYDPKKSLYEQFSKAQGAREGEGELEAAVRRATETGSIDGEDSMAMEGVSSQGSGDPADESEGVSNSEDGDGDIPSSVQRRKKRVSGVRGPNEPPVFAMFSLFEGSSRYKQRRKRNAKMGGPDPGSLVRRGSEDLMDERGRARSTGLGPGGRYAASSASVSRERGPMGMGMNMGMMGVHPSMMDEFGPHIKTDADDAMTAAQMFIKQAHGQLVPADGVVRKPRMQSSVGEVGVYYSEGNPDHAIQPQSSFGDIHLHRHSYPGPVLQHPTLSGSFDGNGIAPFTQTQSHLHPQQQTVESNNSVYEVVDGKTKAFVCHLETCGRLFKRMEHLKRHLRTHTLERPFACTRCRKRFSRSDNLNQHLRTHERVGMSGISSSNGSGGAGLNSGANMNGGIVDWGEEDGDTGEEGSGGSGGHASEGESEDEGVHGMVGYSGGMYAPGTMDMDSMNLGVNPGMGMPLNTFGIMDGLDMQMREADVRDGSEQPLGVQSGQEGGAGANSGSGGQDVYSFSSGNPSAPTNGMMFSSGNGIGPSDFTQEAQWSRPQPSPAFSSVSIPSPPPGPHNGTYAQHIRNNRSISSMRHHTPSHSTSSSAASSVYGGDEFEYDYEYSTSISAPSHKRSFDQNGMFTGLGLMDTGVPGVPASMVAGTSPSAASVASGATGPIRRHRSMTPSLIRSGEQPLRRPMTASNGDLAAAASVSNPTGSANGGSGGGSPSGMSSARGYHPYAPYGTVSTTSRPGSSSPGAYSMQVGAPRRSESRNSSFGAHGAGVGVPAEQISQLMRISLDGGQGQQQQQQQGDQQHQTSMYGDSSYRTDSPSTFQQTESPAPYAIDLPMQFGGGSAGGPGGSNHRHSAPVIYGEHEQFGAQQQQQQQHYPSSAPHAGIGDGFYSAHPQQHITL